MNSKLLTGVLSAVMLTTTVQAETIDLPKPQTDSPLMKAIDARRSGRAYSDKKISEQELSNVLWAAFGVNSHGTRTIPTARNLQDVKVFVIYEGKTWLYDGKNNQLNEYETPDLLPDLASQEFVYDAPVHLIYVGSKRYADAHAGSAYQNVALYAAVNGMSSVVRGLIDRDSLHQKLRLSEDEVVAFHQTLGYPAE